MDIDTDTSTHESKICPDKNSLSDQIPSGSSESSSHRASPWPAGLPLACGAQIQQRIPPCWFADDPLPTLDISPSPSSPRLMSKSLACLQQIY